MKKWLYKKPDITIIHISSEITSTHGVIWHNKTIIVFNSGI